nr:unnamed protein product [Callosobruchus chinensis]
MLSKLVLMLSKRKEMRKIFQNVETIFWRIEDIADETQKTECKKILLQGRYTIHAWTFLFVLWLFFCLRIKSLPLNCYQPKWMPLPFLIALENVTFILLSMGVIAIDGIIMNLFLMTAIQLKMLNREFKSMFDTNDENVIAQKIVKLIQHHDFMLWFTSLINQTISASMVIFLGNIVSNLCIYLYHFSTMNSIGWGIIRDIDVLGGTLIGIFGAYCVPAQICINEAEDIKISAYFSKWYEHPRFKRHISMILARDSLGITITAGGIVKVDLETALSVSYFLSIGSKLHLYLGLTTGPVIILLICSKVFQCDCESNFSKFIVIQGGSLFSSRTLTLHRKPYFKVKISYKRSSVMVSILRYRALKLSKKKFFFYSIAAAEIIDPSLVYTFRL